jgi:hypothetical protein
MFHGTRVGNARLISGLRPENRPKQEPILRTAFNIGGTKETDYPKRFGPGLYLTDNKQDALEYSKTTEKDSGGAVVEGRVTPDNPIHLTEDEFDEIGVSKSSQDLVRRLNSKVNYSRPLPRPEIATIEDMERVTQTKNFKETPEHFQKFFTDYNRGFLEPNTPLPHAPLIKNNTLITGGHRAAANIQLRDGHDYMHITSHNPIWDDKDSQYGILLRPNLRGYPAIFKARAVHFYDSLQRAQGTEEL